MKKRLLMTATCILLGWQAPAFSASNTECQGAQMQKSFNSGAYWQFCWDIADKEGLVLTQIHYQAPGNSFRRILGKASLSQIEATFDDGATDPAYIVTDMGLGGDNLLAIRPEDCPAGDLYSTSTHSNALCAKTQAAGYVYKYLAQRQGEVFEISTLSKIGPRNYQLRWKFYENGVIEPGIGLSGILPAVNESSAQYGWPASTNGSIATSFMDHYLWRLDFDLGDTYGDDLVEEISSAPDTSRLRKFMTINTIQTETGKNLNPETKTFWRVVDGSISNPGVGNISYELVPQSYDQSGANSLNQPWLKRDVYFTRFNNCEQHAVDNDAFNCSEDVSQFANNESLVNKDIVVWYKQSQHFLPRSEDSNRIPMRWNSFKLIPRDWFPRNPL